MKRGKNNKAHLAASLLRKIVVAETTIVNTLPQPIRAAGKTAPGVKNLIVLNAMRTYVLKTKIKDLDPKILKGFSNIVKLIMGNYSYGRNVYHEEPSIKNALIPEEHKETIKNDQTNSTTNA